MNRIAEVPKGKKGNVTNEKREKELQARTKKTKALL